MRVTVLASGSRGNATLVETGDTSVLIDAGISPRVAKQRYEDTRQRPWPRLDAVVVTHLHDDHIRFARSLAQNNGCPVWIRADATHVLGNTDNITLKTLRAPSRFRIGCFTLFTLPIPHDVPQVALRIHSQRKAVGIATDLGHIPDNLADFLAPCDSLLIEANHDPRLLATSHYPVQVKHRIAGPTGHLCNRQTATLLRELRPAPTDVVLMHLSQTSNRPELAREVIRPSLPRDTRLHIAHQDHPTLLDLSATGQLCIDLAS